MEFTRPESLQRDAIKELAEIKIVNEGLEKRLVQMRSNLVDRNAEYDRVFDYSKRRKKLVESQEKQIELLKKKVKCSEEIREAESIRFAQEITKEKTKMKNERNE